ncbi:uncharacterized protein LOC105215597 isoform X2 [Zeugodacus cucurbitae]|uniref:uncharacterized protein LOC105215597 isoform X2 n=1 Tax=Zeugodacus cucurbitae TaxID=28588 RepID=UPI0023D95596|nr:uncharacterized protein LOC105215597 isoform X2 [Zeugodacus cucurbitae]
MREHSTVPNVFRVACSPNVNTTKPQIHKNGDDSKQQIQQQQQSAEQTEQQQKPKILVHTSTLTNATTTATTKPNNNSNIRANGTVGDLTSKQQQQQQQALSNDNNTTATNSSNISNGHTPNTMQPCNIANSAMLHNHTLQPHKLTATASIERTNFGGSVTQTGRREQFQQQQQQQQLLQQQKSQQSLYGTLPRSMPAALQRNSNNKNNRDLNGITASGVINTISGSIPSATAPTTTAALAAADRNGSRSNSSLTSDLNGGYTSAAHSKSNKLNGIQPQQMNKSREFLVTRPGGRMSHHYQQQQQRMRQCGNNNGVQQQQQQHRYGNGGYLWILTPVAASISVAIVMAAIAGPQWLFTEEKLPNANYNGTANFNMMDDGAYLTKYTKSSLWILCTALQGVETYNCIKIDYFPKEGYQPDPHDSTPAIPYTVTKSCPFFLASGVFLLISFIVFLVPTCSHQNNLYYFSAGIMFIVSGLLMLIGLIAYISILKAEIGSKLRSRSSLQPPLFKVTYGQSFFLFVIGFITTEFVGLLNIFLYISLQENGHYNRLPCFNITNLQEKLKESEIPQSHTYKSYKHSTAASTAVAPTVRKPQQGPRLSSNSHHQVHNVCLPPTTAELELNGKLLQHTHGFVPCRKHPNAAEAFVNNDLERRYYFEKSQQPKCNLHSKNFAKSLNELYTESVAGLPPPPPSAVKMGGTSQTLPRMPLQYTQFGDFTQDYPLTRSVSTTTDIFPGHNSRHTTPHVERKSRRNMATNTRPIDPAVVTLSESERGDESENERNVRRRRQLADSQSDSCYDDDEPQRLCGLKRGIRKTKDELFQEFCKRAGMRPKPKNIYFIASEEDTVATSDDEAQQRRHYKATSQLGNGHHNGGGGRRDFGRKNCEVDDEQQNAREADEDDEGEGGFSQLQDEDEHIYVIQDNPQYVTNPTYRNLRRSSMFVEPAHLRKLNSNLSLAALYQPEKPAQKSAFAGDRSDSAMEIWPPPPSFSSGEPYFAAAKSAYYGSQNRLHQDYQPNVQIYQSRTLPRSFLKSHTNSQNSLGSGSLHASATALHSNYSSSQNRLTNLMLQQQHQQQQQQQLQQQNLYLSQSQAAGIYNSAFALHKSSEDLSAARSTNNYGERRQQRPQSSSNNNDGRLQQPTVHWPAAIPSSPSGYAPNYQQIQQLGAPPARSHHPTAPPHLAHALLTRSFSSNTSGGADSGIGSGGGSSSVVSVPPKFQRAYAFDEQRRPSALLGETFDPEELERERRRSHASVYSGISMMGGQNGSNGINNNNNSADHYDLINGTAV